MFRQLNGVLGLFGAPIAFLVIVGLAFRAWRREGDDPEVLDSPSILMAPKTYTSEGLPHESTLATGRPASTVATSAGVSPTAPKIGSEASMAARLGAAVGAKKVVLTDGDGGWGRPPRSFADVATHDRRLW